MKRQCNAKAKSTGKPCQRAPIKGGVVCIKHGGAAPQVRAKAAERLADLIDPDRALREAAKLAYSDIRDLYGPDGKLLAIKDLPDHIAGAISRVKQRKENLNASDGVQEDVVEVVLWDKSKNLDMLFRHLALYNDETTINVNVNLEQRLQEGRKRIALLPDKVAS